MTQQGLTVDTLSPDHPSFQPADVKISPFILSLPKAELHIHLEGAIAPDTLAELSRKYDGDAALTAESAAALYSYPDFHGFLMAFKATTERLRAPEDYELITYRMMERLAAENVLHAEVIFSAGVAMRRGYDVHAIYAGCERGRERGERDLGVSVMWIWDAVRHFGPEAAQRVAEAAARHVGENTVAFGIGGDERRAGPELFRDVFAWARGHGLRLTAHAGESAGPESVWGALNLGAERLGHALHAWQDPELMAVLVERQAPIEACITSNLRTGCCAAIGQHPVKNFFDLGAMVTLNSDDPAMFGTSLAREYALGQQQFGFTDEHLRELARNSFEASFLPAEKKIAFLDRVDAVGG
ncbi:MAG TPA: adenosine deaminase [Terriglobales bacterium]|nr:adenosine deaminase [Terriglobales bacterium]